MNPNQMPPRHLDPTEQTDTAARRRSRPLRVAVASLTFLCLLLPLVPASAGSENTEAASPPGSIRFVGKNRIATGDGIFHAWRFTKFAVDPDDIGKSEVVVEVDVASIDTDSSKRDEHLRADDFFDAATYPTAQVRVFGAAPVPGSPNDYTAKFEVTIRDVTKIVDGTFALNLGPPAKVEGQLQLNRTDFGIGEPYSAWNPLSIKETIPIEFSAEHRLETP